MATTRIKRFSAVDRLFHVFLILTFITQTISGFSRLYVATSWGRRMTLIFGGYETSGEVHKWVGVIMIAGFVVHTIVLLAKIDWKHLIKSLFGPDSIVPNLQDFKHLKEQILWFFGRGPAPRFDRWTYFEKFDYWAVYWGMPLLAVTGLMLMFPLAASKLVPGWFLNISQLLHRAEAILAVSYIFIVHFFVGHLRPSSFPMNEAMFAGSITMATAEEEKPGWVERLTREHRQIALNVPSPPAWYRVAYYLFGYAVLTTGIYLLINGIIYSRSVNLH